MDRHFACDIASSMADAFTAPVFLKTLAMDQGDALRLFDDADWDALLAPLLPLRHRIVCSDALTAFLPLLNAIAPLPQEGWLDCAYQTAVSLLYPANDRFRSAAEWDGALCFLRFLQVLFDEERETLPFDPWLDFAFCTETELAHSDISSSYHRFLKRFRGEYLYELLRLGREVTPFRTLEHIAGVHHVAMSVSRMFHSAGGLIDLGLISAAAAGHDLGKFGCRPGERVPYLHYYYTNEWFAQRDLTAIGQIAANHSVWDLELENLSVESLVLVYADFRVKQSRDDSGVEFPQLYSLQDAFDVILQKLDHVDDAKEQRYRYVYEKLLDFERYLRSYGVDVTLKTAGGPKPPVRDAALLTPEEATAALRLSAVEHNTRLMHRLGREALFSATLEKARGETSPQRIRAYLSIFQEYFTYWSAGQKEQTLRYLYELLLTPDGDIRLQAAALLGRILAGFRSGYQKELPSPAVPSPEQERPFALWETYLETFLQPDRHLTPRQRSRIRYQAKTLVEAVLSLCSGGDASRFASALIARYRAEAPMDAETAFALLDAGMGIPKKRASRADLMVLTQFSLFWLGRGGLTQKAASARLLNRLLPLPDSNADAQKATLEVVQAMDCCGSTSLLFLKAQLLSRLGFNTVQAQEALQKPEAVSGILLDNLKTATPWVLKAVGVDYLLEQALQGGNVNVLHIAAHFSNLLKVSEYIVVRRAAGAALLSLASCLTPEHRNEIVVELCKALETGQAEISQYIPQYLGQFALWLAPRELDEVFYQIETLLTSANSGIAAAALSTVGAMLEHFSEYGVRFSPEDDWLFLRRKRMAGMLLKALVSPHEAVRQESLRIWGEELFASSVLSASDKATLFALTAKKLLVLLEEQPETDRTFFYTAAALSHLYRFLIHHQLSGASFSFSTPPKVAFFPGTFDPFSLAHLGIVRMILERGFEIYLAIDEFSWSKKAQPSLIRRQLATLSVADEFDVYLFPHDFPVNLANAEDLNRLRAVFSGRPVYLVVGADVIAGASAYRAPPQPGSVHAMGHILFRRAGDTKSPDFSQNLAQITGELLSVRLPPQLEEISSTRIRENIDLGRDISQLVDPTVQEVLYRNSLYLREPQFKQIIRLGPLECALLSLRDAEAQKDLKTALVRAKKHAGQSGAERILTLRDRGKRPRLLGFVTLFFLEDPGLFEALGDETLANRVRTCAGGRVCLVTGLTKVRGGIWETEQLLMTEALALAVRESCTCAVWHAPASDDTLSLLARQGFLPLGAQSPVPLLRVDLRSPVALIQNISTVLKEPFASDRQVSAAIHTAHIRFQQAVCALYPGSLVLSLNAELLHHRLVEKITAKNGVSPEPVQPRKLGEKMCVPFGKLLRGSAVPNTVTKTLHTDKVFARDLRSFTIEAFPGYAPLQSQIRTLRSFGRSVILVDDLLHSGNRMNALDPLFHQEGLEIDEVLVGLLSGRGRDLMAARGRNVDCVYFVPNLRAWFVESTMYPFIGGDTVAQSPLSFDGLKAAVNLILPYAFPAFYRECGHSAVFQFSRVCLENARDLLLALEQAYRERYVRSLTLSRLSEAVILPLVPDKGGLSYDPTLTASAALESDLELLLRTRDALKSETP